MAGHCGWAAAQAQSGPTVGDHAVRLCGNTTADEAGPRLRTWLPKRSPSTRPGVTSVVSLAAVLSSFFLSSSSCSSSLMLSSSTLGQKSPSK